MRLQEARFPVLRQARAVGFVADGAEVFVSAAAVVGRASGYIGRVIGRVDRDRVRRVLIRAMALSDRPTGFDLDATGSIVLKYGGAPVYSRLLRYWSAR